MVDPKDDYSAGKLVDCSAVPKAQQSADPKAEMKVSWMVHLMADYSAGMMVYCSADPKAQHSADPKAEWTVETMAVLMAASTAEK